MLILNQQLCTHTVTTDNFICISGFDNLGMQVVWYTKYLLPFCFVIISPWLIRSIYNNFVRCIPKNAMPLTSHIFIMIVSILLQSASFWIYNGPSLMYLSAYIIILSVIGFFLSLLPVCLHLMIIGVPCAYLDTLVRDLTTKVEIDEDKIEHAVHEYKKFQKQAGPYLFLIYSTNSCILIALFYKTAILISCYPQEKVIFLTNYALLYFIILIIRNNNRNPKLANIFLK